MFYKFLNYLNSIKSFPYYFVTPLPYGIGTCAKHILLSICIKSKKEIILLYPNILKKFFNYNICNRYLFDQIIIDEFPQSKYKFLKKVITFLINIEFIIRRIIFFLFNSFNIKLGEQFRFPLIGVLPIFINNEKKKISLNTQISINIDFVSNLF